MQRLVTLLGRFERLVAGLAYIVMTAMIAGEIAVRELFGSTLLGSEKIAILSSVIAGFIGFTLVTQSGRHLRVSAFDGLIPLRWREAHRRIADLVSAILLLGLTWIAFEFLRDSITFREKVEVLYIPRWPFQSVIVYAFLSSSLKHLAFFLEPTSRPAGEGAL